MIQVGSGKPLHSERHANQNPEPDANSFQLDTALQRWPKISLAVLVLGQATVIIQNIESIRTAIVKWLTFDNLVLLDGATQIVAPALAAIGMAGLVYWVCFRLLGDRPAGVRRLAGLLGIGAILASAALAYWALPKPDHDEVIRNQAVTFNRNILDQQLLDGDQAGGFRFSTKGQSQDAQAWTTAQCLAALLGDPAAVSDSAPQIRAGFEYLERVRDPELGWGYIAGDGIGITEINAWAVVAQSRALRPVKGIDIWPQDLHEQASSRLLRDVRELAARQHGDGGWGPLLKSDRPDYERTYSTVMALWALIEARETKAVSSTPDWVFDQGIVRGARWLLEHRVNDADGAAGWSTVPTIPRPPHVIPGLTGQAVFVLNRIARQFPQISSEPAYGKALSEFVDLSLEGGQSHPAVSTQKLSVNQKGHDTDGYFAELPRIFPQWRWFRPESSTYLWYPWTLAAAVSARDDSSQSDIQRQKAAKLVEVLVKRSMEAPAFTSGDPAIYPTAETNLAYGLFLATSR